MESARESLLLTETKRLLTALNDENRELKTEITRLISQCSAATERVMCVTRDKESLEKDLKQINFNLMQQLRVKMNTLKEKEHQVLQLQEQVTKLESQLQELRLKLESTAKENEMRREQTTALEARLHQQTERLFRAEAVAGKYADDLNSTMSEYRESTAKMQRASQERVKQLEEELRASRNREVSLERVVDELRYELSRAKEALRQSNSNNNNNNNHNNTNNMNMNNVEGRRRALSTRSEALYAHEQILTSCSSSYQQLRELQQKLRSLESLLSENTMYMEQTFPAREAQLREEVERFTHTDEALVAFLCQGITEKEQQLQKTQEKLAHTERYLEQVEEAHEEKLEAERREHKEACNGLQKQVSGLQQQLQIREDTEQKLRTELKDCQRSLDAEREQTEAVRRSYEKDVERLDGQLQEFTTIVSHALHKLEPSVQAHSQQRQQQQHSSKTPLSSFSLNSVTVKPSLSAFAGTTSMECDDSGIGRGGSKSNSRDRGIGGFMTLSNTTELGHEGGMSPSVVRIEPLPSAP
ncbi:uncharacterized protein TM35_000061420 [Trypanosoma theileri]|uniref:Uncharacterized protein n=1 Tax=Trypanosoma theileri TaxID=67003 RepID=A0A1X0P2I3_9TRYP|nr:uncharacterized protein TM35_000061420 [Trypanosoma theileri]ORC91137.1 hypothetical protein TM35_000061420 [Trypanosoma theileri]